jgi:subtilisin family serine protease
MSHRPGTSRVLATAAALLLALPLIAFAAPPKIIPGELIVRYKDTTTPAARAGFRGRADAALVKEFQPFRMEHLRLRGMSTEAAMRRFERDPDVEYVEPNYEITLDAVPNDPRFPELYGMRNTGQTGGTPGADIRATNAWDVFTGDPNLKIGVIDTGVDYNHPDLAANVWTNPGEIPGNSVDDDGNGYVDDVHGYDFANNDGDPFDDNGHGSHCSGTIAGVGNNNVGVTGVNWNAKIIGIKFLSASGSGSTAGAISGVQYAIAVGCRLTSNSWGGGGFSQALLDAINAAGAAGQLFIAAAGNSSANTDVSPHYPSSYDSPYIIAVAATDHNDNLASFSNFGATTVDLAAPGVAILSCQPGGGYQLLSGTSMATPHVAGVAGLAMGRFPAASNLFIKQLILNGADPRPQLAGKVLTGARLNAFLAIADPDVTNPGAVSDLAVTETGSSHIRISWTATGDDGNTGTASAYDLRYSEVAIVDEATFAAATPTPGPDPLPAGQAETHEIAGLAPNTTYFIALKALDEFGNAGPISNVATGLTAGPPDLAASPTSFSSTLLTGAAETQTLTLSNVGQGTLDYSIPTPELMFSQPVLYEYQPLAKGEDDIRVGQPVMDGQGGPDGFGYRWIDSNESGGPTFAWEDITGTGTQLALTGDDATSAAVPIGFDFPFYGGSFGSVRVCTNGWLSFTSTATAYDNQLLPNAGAPENLLAPFWDDLDFGATARVYTYGDASHFVVSWVGVPHYQSGGPYTFQVVLYPSGEIRFQYLSVASPTNSSTVGIQNATRTIGLTTAFNTNYVANNLAVRIVPLSQWLTVTPTSGRIPAGQSHDLNVQFNALGVEGGIFDGTIRINSNDPDENPTLLAAQLHVLGAPDVSLSPNPVDFGTFFVGANPTRTLAVHNPGTDALLVSNITSSDPDVSPDVTAFTLNPHQTRNVVLTFSPATARVLAGTVTVSSNDPDTPSLAVGVVGEATPAPQVLASPDSFEETLLTNTATSRSLRLTNTGGSNYTFTAGAEIFGASGSVTVFGDADNVELEKGAPDSQFGPAPLASGGPDVFGYTFQDSDVAGGPTFAWVDISATGTAIPLNGDDQNLGPFPMGFSFPHYGVNHSSFRVTSNGWLTLNATNTQTTFTNTALPNSGTTVPPSLFAVFWDDLDFRPTQAPNARAYYLYDGTRTIVQYKGVPRRGESGTTATNDFQVIFYPTGEVVYQYLTMNAVLKTSATIGMQNAAKNDGLQVVFNAAYVKNNLAIRFRPPARFLTVTPASGTITPGNFLDLTVGFNAAGLFGGTYEGQVKVTGNDPVRPQVLVPATLHVTGVPDIATNPGAVAFGNVFTGFPQLRELRVLNTGTDALVVSNIVSSDAAYGVDQTSFSVPPLGQALLFVTFNPPGAADFPATLTISSNDPDSPNSVVSLSGSGLIAPDVDPQPASISQTLLIPGTASQTLTLHNLGGSDLDFVVGTLLTAATAPSYEALELGKEEPDPRPGVLGSGGPDVFGYRWADSDEAGGPAFDWVDITALGTPVPFTSGDDNNVQGIPIGFSFPFYGNTFSTVNVCTNGWISFTNTTTDLSNDPLPNSAAPENMVAVFWDDLLPGTSPARVFRYNDGTRFIVSWVGVPRFSSGGPYTFQAILYPSGRIVCQYLSMQGTRLNEATIGIQNAARNDGLTVVHNANYVHDGLAVQFATVPEYMTVTPSTGTVPAGGSVALNVQFDSNGLFGGVYEGAIRVASNDPDETVLLVPTQLDAIGTPHIGAQPAALDFGTQYVGLTTDRSVTLRNIGSHPLEISGVSIDNGDWTLVGAPSLPVTLGQNGALPLTLRWAPSGACSPCAGTLSVDSNDPNAPTLAVPLSGTGLIPPEIGVDPASLQAALATTLGPTALTTTKQLVISNTGGSDLDWTAEALSALPAAVVGPDAEGPKDDPGAPGALGNGGPDAFGYRWADSDDPNGPAFSWVDITGVGTPIPFSGDDQNQGPIALPFPFTFYGHTFNSVRVCTNGWLSFTSTLTTFTNTVLPSGGATAPENLIAPFWDDHTFSSAGDAYYHYDGSKFIVSWVGVPRLGSGGPYTFQVLLYPSGTIDFQYLDMQGTRLNEATVGIQNGTKDVGLQVVFNAAYVKNNLRVRFSNQPGWLTVSPASGVTAAGESDTVLVTFDATGLADGDYTGSVRVRSNDLDEPLVTVPADLHVGVAETRLRIDPNTLNLKSQGRWVSAIVWPPMGTDAHLIVQSSLLLERQVPADPKPPAYLEEPTEPEDGWRWSALYKFDRYSLLGILPEGPNVPVEVIGRLADVTWFRAVDHVRVQRPRISIAGTGLGGPEAPMPSIVQSESYLPLHFSDPADGPASAFELWYSPDAGESWSAVDSNITARDYGWSVPEEATEQAMLGLVARDELGVMGSHVTNLFQIIHGTTDVKGPAPTRFALRYTGHHPASRARLEFGLPARGEVSVRVYDVKGALVRELARGPYEPGWHSVTWDGAGASGSPAEPGMYFVQANANGQRLLKRFVLIR